MCKSEEAFLLKSKCCLFALYSLIAVVGAAVIWTATLDAQENPICSSNISRNAGTDSDNLMIPGIKPVDSSVGRAIERPLKLSSRDGRNRACLSEETNPEVDRSSASGGSGVAGTRLDVFFTTKTGVHTFYFDALTREAEAAIQRPIRLLHCEIKGMSPPFVRRYSLSPPYTSEHTNFRQFQSSGLTVFLEKTCPEVDAGPGCNGASPAVFLQGVVVVCG